MADTADDLEFTLLRAKIADRSVFFGSQRRKRAGERLAALGTPAAARILAEAFIANSDPRVAKIARQALTRLSDQAGYEDLIALAASCSEIPTEQTPGEATQPGAGTPPGCAIA